MNRFGIICYVPPPHIGHPLAFSQNLRNFPPLHPLVIYSDHDYSKEWPGCIKIAASPEIARVDTNKMSCNNLVFFVGMRIAASRGFTHIMLLEPDCRVNAEHWDDIVWQEFQFKNPNAIAGGSMVVFNPCSYNRQSSEQYEKFLMDSKPSRIVPISITGSGNLAEKRDSCVFPNGAFAIYRMDWLLKTYPQITGKPQEYIALAKTERTWDYSIGIRLWNEFHESVYDKVVSLGKVYSGYGQIMSTEDERKQWLIDGKVVGVHQIKSDWIGPEPKPIQDFVSVGDVQIPKTEIFIVSYAKDFAYLEYCLRSIKKFAAGFSGVTVLVPSKDVHALRTIVGQIGIENVRSISGYEWRGRGMLWHMAQVCRADEWCPHADYIAHFDADCIFTKPVTPNTFWQLGKPLLRYEPFATLAQRHPGVLNWKVATENALPFNIADEFMRGLPHIYGRTTYAKTRELVEQKTKRPFNDYIKSCKNEYPQTFCEYVTLGSVARQYFADDYTLCDLSRDANPDRSPYPVQQFWSHRAPDEPQEVCVDGIMRNVIPAEFVKEILK